MSSNRVVVFLALSLVAIVLIIWPSGVSPDSGEAEKTGGVVDETLELYNIQTGRPLTSSERDELAEKVDWMGRLEGNAILVRTEPENINRLKELPYVKEINTYQPQEKITGELKNNGDREAAGGTHPPAGEQIELMVTLVKGEDKPDIVKLVEQFGGAVIDGAATPDVYLRIKLPVTNLEQLTASPRVLYVEEYHQPEFLNDRAGDITGAAPLAVPDFITPGGLTGKNLIIGLADSGLDTGKMGNLHPDLSNDPGKQPRVLMINSLAGTGVPADKIGHGTHMAGTIAGSGAASGGKYAGIAPEASIYFQGIVDANGNISPPLDLQRLFMPAYEAGVRIHVNGWGRKNNRYTSTSAQIDRFVRGQVDFLPIFGAGNFGPDAGTLTTEANSKNALVVGASRSPRPAFDNDKGNTFQVAGFSSSGPAGDGRIKPELVAPGTSIISTSSSLVESNLPGQTHYTRMQGTSMATAVTGGSAALLAEYLQRHTTGIEKPSAALFKAVLINGARSLEGDLYKTGFGLLDMTGTILALEQDLFYLVDEQKGVAEGETLAWEFEVTDSKAPFKVTLAWTDPPASPAAKTALVNNLDLVVTGPGGKKYLGNDRDGRGLQDNINNVEQVVIEKPAPGKYKIEVCGTSVDTNASAVLNMVKQDFALVYGQPPVQSTVTGVAQDKLTLADGTTVDRPENLKTILNGEIVSGVVLPGADLYLAGPSVNPAALAVSRNLQVPGIKVLTSEEGTLLVRINRQYREGGYYIDEHPKNTIELNGMKLSGATGIPPGAGIEASVNPTSQRLWRVQATSHEQEGIIKSLDLDNRELELLNNDKLKIDPNLAIMLNDTIVEGDPEALPFGAPVSSDVENIVPGMPVRLIMDQDQTVYYMALDRHIVVGGIAAVDVNGGKITLTSGGEYQVLPGVKMLRNNRESSMQALRPGDLVMGTVNPGTNQLLGLTVYTTWVYGKVFFAGQNTLYITDNNQVNREYKFTPKTQVYRWGLASDTSLLAPGQWVRLIIDTGTNTLFRVDIAETGFQGQEVIESWDRQNSRLSTTSGKEYIISSKTSVTKNGYPVHAGDLRSGEEVALVSLRGQNNKQILVSAAASSYVENSNLSLSVDSTIPFEEFTIIKGKTPATKLTAWYADGRSEPVQLTGGEFYYPVYYPHGGGVQLVAVDEASGAVTGISVKLPNNQGKVFEDLDGHWAETDVLSLVSRGLIAGYAGDTFRPGQPISRAEFTVMLARLLGGQNNTVPRLEFADNDQIPAWARSSVYLASVRGLVTGYEDNTFRPRALLTRAEAAVMFIRLAQALNMGWDETKPVPQYNDAVSIPDWALSSVDSAGRAGLLTGRPGNKFEPQANITRAETAAVMNRLLKLLNSPVARAQ